MCEVMRAPFWPSGSLAIWTMISWPSRSRSLMDGCADFSGARCGALRLRLGFARGLPAPALRARASRRAVSSGREPDRRPASCGACGATCDADIAGLARARWRSRLVGMRARLGAFVLRSAPSPRSALSARQFLPRGFVRFRLGRIPLASRLRPRPRRALGGIGLPSSSTAAGISGPRASSSDFRAREPTRLNRGLLPRPSALSTLGAVRLPAPQRSVSLRLGSSSSSARARLAKSSASFRSIRKRRTWPATLPAERQSPRRFPLAPAASPIAWRFLLWARASGREVFGFGNAAAAAASAAGASASGRCRRGRSRLSRTVVGCSLVGPAAGPAGGGTSAATARRLFPSGRLRWRLPRVAATAAGAVRPFPGAVPSLPRC